MTMLEDLRSKLNGNEAFLITYDGPHLIEQPAKEELYLKHLASFTGSAGMALVTLNEAFIFVDGRYTLAVKFEVDAKVWQILPIGEVVAKAKEFSLIRVFGDNISVNFFGKLADNEVNLDIVKGSVDACLPKTRQTIKPAFNHGAKYVGRDTREKLARVIKKGNLENYDYYVTSMTESICWLLNVRGWDTDHLPIVKSFLAIDAKTQQIYWFVDEKKLANVMLDEKLIIVKPYNEFRSFLEGIKDKTVALDESNNNYFVIDILGTYISVGCPIDKVKSVKDETELANIKEIHVLDGVAVARFLCWLDDMMLKKEHVDELSAARKLEELRRENEKCVGLSFPSISGSRANSALIHYNSSEATNKKLGGMYLIDSGGNYYGGGTDITRTVLLTSEGKEVADMAQKVKDFTLVLKAHIAFAQAKVPKGTCGFQLDALVRAPLWQEGLDYAHGTGHGVGYFLNIHEGPQSVSSNIYNRTPLEPGMVVSNEPGVYRQGLYGIRIENLVCLNKDEKVDECVSFLHSEFITCETITLAPIDLKLVGKEMLSNDEIQWLNDYHAKVYKEISSMLNEHERAWLKRACREI